MGYISCCSTELPVCSKKWPKKLKEKRRNCGSADQTALIQGFSESPCERRSGYGFSPVQQRDSSVRSRPMTQQHCQSMLTAGSWHRRKILLHETRRRVAAFFRCTAERRGQNDGQCSVWDYEQARHPASFLHLMRQFSLTIMMQLLHDDSQCLAVTPVDNHKVKCYTQHGTNHH